MMTEIYNGSKGRPHSVSRIQVWSWLVGNNSCLKKKREEVGGGVLLHYVIPLKYYMRAEVSKK